MAWTYDKIYLKDPEFKAWTVMTLEAISGGLFVAASGPATTSPLTSGVIEWGDLRAVKAGTIQKPETVIGVAMKDTSISGVLTVITDGFLVMGIGSDNIGNGVTAGQVVRANRVITDAIQGVIDANTDGYLQKSGAGIVVGRSWTTGAKSEAAFVRLRV